MNSETVQQLLSINRQFYQTFAVQFSATRQRLQPGVQRILTDLPDPIQILDIGCGNGELWQALRQSGRSGFYLGIDFSPGLYQEAQAAHDPDDQLPGMFLETDLGDPGWAAAVMETLQEKAPGPGQQFNIAVAFAVLHHLPGQAMRRQTLNNARACLAPGGRLALSVWQFLNSSRMRERIQPWQAAGISPEAVDPGDYLLDWRRGGYGLRYVHHFERRELEELAQESGFRIQDDFTSDGENGRLGYYQIWEAAQ